MTAKISRALAVISTIGWLSTIGLNVAALASVGLPFAPNAIFTALFFALFPLYLSALLTLGVGMKNTPYTSRSWVGHAIDRAPQWAKFTLWGSLAYMTVTAAAALIFGEQLQVQLFDFGIWTAMFSFPVLIFSTMSISVDCPKGHAVGPFEQYCPTCGAPILANARG